MRLFLVFGGILAASFCHGQTEIEQQRKALRSLPAISYDEILQCVKLGDSPSTATTKFGDPTSGKAGMSLTGRKSTTFSWPEAGLYREFHVGVLGEKYFRNYDAMSEKMWGFYDGEKSYSLLEGTTRRQIHVDSRRNGAEPPSIFSSPVFLGYDISSFKKVSTSTDPKFGTLVHFEGKGVEMDIAPDRDYMTVHTKSSNIESWVLEAQKFEGHWIATKMKDLNTYSTPVEVFTTIKSIKALPKADQVFKPAYKTGTLVVDSGVYYDVDKSGGLVKSKNQPDRTTEYLSWAGMGAFAIFVLSVIVVGMMKLMRKPEGTVR